LLDHLHKRRKIRDQYGGQTKEPQGLNNLGRKKAELANASFKQSQIEPASNTNDSTVGELAKKS